MLVGQIQISKIVVASRLDFFPKLSRVRSLFLPKKRRSAGSFPEQRLEIGPRLQGKLLIKGSSFSPAI